MYSVVNKVAHIRAGFADVDRLAVLPSTDYGARHQRTAADLRESSRHCWSAAAPSSPLASPGRRRAGHPHGLERRQPGRADARGRQRAVDRRQSSRCSPQPIGSGDFNDVVKQKEARAIVISYDTWQHRLGGSPGVIGTTVHVDGEPRPVIGVMPQGFALVPWADRIAFWRRTTCARFPRRAG
jgi:hypothetical protein